jgi:hypothetical protein
MKEGAIVAVSAVVARGAGPKKDYSKKDLASSITIFSLGCHVFCMAHRGGKGRGETARMSLPSQLERTSQLSW